MKRLCANDSAGSRVKVGHRQVSITKSPFRLSGWGFFYGRCFRCPCRRTDIPALPVSANASEDFGNVIGCGVVVEVVFVTRGGLRRFDRSDGVELTLVGNLFDSVDRIEMPTAAEGVVAFVLLVSTRVVGHRGAHCQPTAC